MYASLKKNDDVYSIEKNRALELLKEKEERQKVRQKKQSGKK
jgi:topoisomerase IA-like protein